MASLQPWPDLRCQQPSDAGLTRTLVSGKLHLVTTTALHLIPALNALAENDRAELAHVLITSLDDNTSGDADAAWDAELTRRKEDILSGKSVGIPAARSHTP